MCSLGQISLQHGALGFCGLDVLPPQAVHAVHRSAEVRELGMEDWKKRLTNLVNEKPMSFQRNDDTKRKFCCF